MADAKLLSVLADGVLTLTLNRPDKLNAIDNDLARLLLEALETGATNPAVHVVIVRGSGRAFCAGRDVGAAPTDRDLELVQAVANAIVCNPRPVVAEVHGWTVGAGFEWMMCADVVVAAADARFKLPEASLGVFVTGGLGATLPAAIGLARAKAIALLGEVVTARQALEWGLLWKVVAPEELRSETRDIALAIARLAPAVAQEFKRVFNKIGLPAFHAAQDLESAAQRRLGRGESPSEG